MTTIERAEQNAALADAATRIKALLESCGAKVAYCHMSRVGFVLRTDDVGAALATVKLASLFESFSVDDATAAEIAHFGTFDRTVRGHL